MPALPCPAPAQGCFDYTLDEAAHMLGFGSPTTLKKEVSIYARAAM